MRLVLGMLAVVALSGCATQRQRDCGAALGRPAIGQTVEQFQRCHAQITQFDRSGFPSRDRPGAREFPVRDRARNGRPVYGIRAVFENGRLVDFCEIMDDLTRRCGVDVGVYGGNWSPY